MYASRFVKDVELSPDEYKLPHAVWVIGLRDKSVWEILITHGALIPLFQLTCVRWEGEWDEHLCVLVGLRTPVLLRWVTGLFACAYGVSCSCMPLLKPVAVLLKRWMKHKPPASVICCIEHCPGAFHGFGRYVPIYGMEVPPSAQWQQHAFANGDPPWVMHHVPRVAKGDIETYRHSYTSPGFGGYPQINFVGECLFVVSTSSLKSIVQAFTAVHGPCGCAGFAVMNGSVDSTSWAGEPFAIVDCRGCDVTQLIKQLKTPRLIRGCIAIIFHVEVRTQEPISRDEFHSFYASSHRLQWRSSILKN